MSLEALMRVAPPAARPIGPGSPEEWAEVERLLGTALPEEYKAFINVYGTGGFCDFLYVRNPFTTRYNFYGNNEMSLKTYRAIRESDPEFRAFPVFPEPGGLLTWGYTDNGDTIYWRTTGRPEEWTVVLYDGKLWICEEYAMSMTEFLIGALTGQIVSDILPDDLLDPDVSLFQPDPYLGSAERYLETLRHRDNG